MNVRLIAECQSGQSSSHVRAGWEFYAWTWRPTYGAGRANWGYYLSFRWLGLLVDAQLFAPQGVEARR